MERQYGKNASTGTFYDAALFGDIVVIATNWQGTENAIKMPGLNIFTQQDRYRRYKSFKN